MIVFLLLNDSRMFTQSHICKHVLVQPVLSFLLFTVQVYIMFFSLTYRLAGCVIHPVMCVHLCHAQVACHSLLSEAASHGHVAMVKTLCQKYQCDPMDAVKVIIMLIPINTN